MPIGSSESAINQPEWRVVSILGDGRCLGTSVAVNRLSDKDLLTYICAPRNAGGQATDPTQRQFEQVLGQSLFNEFARFLKQQGRDEYARRILAGVPPSEPHQLKEFAEFSGVTIVVPHRVNHIASVVGILL